MDQPTERWRIEVNDRYSKVVTSVISLATGALVLPVLILRDLLGIKAQTLLPLLTWAAYVAWGCLGFTILLGLIYFWLSAKWVKLALGQPISLSAAVLESVLDITYVLMMFLFLVGIAATVWFLFATHVPPQI